MKSFKYVVTDAEGIHARPAGQLVKIAKQYKDTEINLIKDGKAAKATKTLGVMSLGVKAGDEVELTFEGPSEDAAYDTMLAFFNENL